MANIELTEMELVHTSIALAREILRYEAMDPTFFDSELNSLKTARAKVISVLKAEYPMDEFSVPDYFQF